MNMQNNALPITSTATVNCDYHVNRHEIFSNSLIDNEEHDGNISEPMSFSSSPSPVANIQPHTFEHTLSTRVNGLRSIHEIPQKYQHIFSSYPCFNAVQTQVFDDVLYSDISVVVSAPTGSGKTVIFELAIIRLLINLEAVNYTGEYKIVYVAPVKALCSERYADWKAKFSSLGLTCQEFTGDTDDAELTNLAFYHLILTTPEKWDSLTRKWKDNTALVQMVKLFLIDEVQLLNEEQRGPTLEAVVSRMKTIQKVIGVTQKQEKENISHSLSLLCGIRFLAVSATIPNADDIACWLSESIDKPAKYFKISEDLRPVKLHKVVLGYPCPTAVTQFRFEISLSYKLHNILFKYADGKPSLIFCSTRKGVEQTCNTLIHQITFQLKPEQKTRISEVANTITENKLRDCVTAGVGYHHAGMSKEDRQAVECLFREGILPVLVTTSTLAMGVNLPAHLVIVKATQQYIAGGYKEYTETQILQMIGRAGRPQYDSSAVAVIMTKESQKPQYEKLVTGKELIESKLHKHLAEHLNSEVVLRTITDIGYAMEWIRSTYLYVRALQNPSHYGIQGKLNAKNIENKLQEMCQRELNALASAKLVMMDLMDVHPTANGILMARYYLQLGTMKNFLKVKGNENLEEMVKLVSACEEFSGVQLRVSEKKSLNTLNKSRDHECIRFPLPSKIVTKEMKVNCLIQAMLGCLPIHEPSLKQEALRIIWIGKRVTTALVQYLVQHRWYRAQLSAATLAKCFHTTLWEDSPYLSRQLKGIGLTLSAMLARSNKNTFQSIIDANPRDLESIINRPPPAGDNLKAEVLHLPNFELRIENDSNLSFSRIKICIAVTNRTLIQEHNTAGKNHWLVLLVGDCKNNCILRDRFRDTSFLEKETACWTVEINDTDEVYVDLISEQWVGMDVHSSIKILQSKGIFNINRPLAQRESKCNKRLKQTNSSILDTIKEMSEKRLERTPGTSAVKLTLDKFSYRPRNNPKLRPFREMVGNTEDIEVYDCVANATKRIKTHQNSLTSSDECSSKSVSEANVSKSDQLLSHETNITETENTGNETLGLISLDLQNSLNSHCISQNIRLESETNEQDNVKVLSLSPEADPHVICLEAKTDIYQIECSENANHIPDERRVLFLKNLPKHCYPVFKPLKPDITLNNTNIEKPVTSTNQTVLSENERKTCTFTSKDTQCVNFYPQKLYHKSVIPNFCLIEDLEQFIIEMNSFENNFNTTERRKKLDDDFNTGFIHTNSKYLDISRSDNPLPMYTVCTSDLELTRKIGTEQEIQSTQKFACFGNRGNNSLEREKEQMLNPIKYTEDINKHSKTSFNYGSGITQKLQTQQNADILIQKFSGQMSPTNISQLKTETPKTFQHESLLKLTNSEIKCKVNSSYPMSLTCEENNRYFDNALSSQQKNSRYNTCTILDQTKGEKEIQATQKLRQSLCHSDANINLNMNSEDMNSTSDNICFESGIHSTPQQWRLAENGQSAFRNKYSQDVSKHAVKSLNPDSGTTKKLPTQQYVAMLIHKISEQMPPRNCSQLKAKTEISEMFQRESAMKHNNSEIKCKTSPQRISLSCGRKDEIFDNTALNQNNTCINLEQETDNTQFDSEQCIPLKHCELARKEQLPYRTTYVQDAKQYAEKSLFPGSSVTKKQHDAVMLIEKISEQMPRKTKIRFTNTNMSRNES